MKNTKVTIPDNVDMHVIGAPDFLTNPMSLMEQWMYAMKMDIWKEMFFLI